MGEGADQCVEKVVSHSPPPPQPVRWLLEMMCFPGSDLGPKTHEKFVDSQHAIFRKKTWARSLALQPASLA